MGGVLLLAFGVASCLRPAGAKYLTYAEPAVADATAAAAADEALRRRVVARVIEEVRVRRADE